MAAGATDVGLLVSGVGDLKQESKSLKPIFVWGADSCDHCSEVLGGRVGVLCHTRITRLGAVLPQDRVLCTEVLDACARYP